MTLVSSEPIRKTSARLADGREIVYFDETPGLDRALACDTRPLPPRPPGPPGPGGSAEQGIRWDPLAGEWVVIAAARQDRTFLPPAGQCPLDPSAPGRPTEIPASSYDVRGRATTTTRGGTGLAAAGGQGRTVVPPGERADS